MRPRLGGGTRAGCQYRPFFERDCVDLAQKNYKKYPLLWFSLLMHMRTAVKSGKEGVVKGESTNIPTQNLIEQRNEVQQNLFVADICTTNKIWLAQPAWRPFAFLEPLPPACSTHLSTFISVLGLAVAGASASYGRHMKIGPYRRLFCETERNRFSTIDVLKSSCPSRSCNNSTCYVFRGRVLEAKGSRQWH